MPTVTSLRAKSAEEGLHPLMLTLTLAGGLPFLGCAVGAWRIWPLPFDPAYVAVIYSAVILSFLGGIQWSACLRAPKMNAVTVISSNLLALLGWAAVLIFSVNPVEVCLFMLLGFLYALWVDSGLHRQALIPEAFFRLRLLITAIVVTCLLITAAGQHFAMTFHIASTN